jgi:hypothetical protein
VYQTIQLPLPLDFLFPSQAKAIKSFVRADVTKHRFDDRHTMAVDLFAFVAIDTLLHPVGVVRGALVFLYYKRDLPTVTFAMIG